MDTAIQKFYSDATILVTGATGFMGKCLLEKLLRSCPKVGKIYILVREKRGKNAAGRLDELFQDVLFSKLKNKSDKYRDKIVPILGDISSAGLGLSLHDRNLLQNEVNIVFHMAATVNFKEKLKLAYLINVRGTQEILELCKSMKNLQSVVYVSTAYSNCTRNKIEEKFYPCPISPSDLSSLLAKLDDPSVEEMTPKILGDWPNSYTLTKAVAESLIKDSNLSFPLAIFRPAIIVSTWREPIQGWTDSINGVNGVCVGFMMGILNSLWCDETLNACLVPIDPTINALIACAWHTASTNKNQGVCCKIQGALTHPKEINENQGVCYNNQGVFKNPEENRPENAAINDIDKIYENPYRSSRKMSNDQLPKIYNYVSCVEKPITWAEFIAINKIYTNKYPLKNAIWLPNIHISKRQSIHMLYMIFFQLIPSVCIDVFTVLLGKKARLVKIYRQSEKVNNIFSYFLTRSIQFTNNNVQELWQNLSMEDKELFPFSMSQMDWLDYFRTYIPGLRKYLCKDDEKSIPAAKIKQRRIHVASTCIKMILYFVSVYTVFCTVSKILKYLMYILKY